MPNTSVSETLPPAAQVPTVMVVDDDPTFRLIVTRILERSGYRVEGFDSGEACLEGLGRLLPDVICLDLSLPGIDGLQTLEHIRATHPLLPVIMLTATSSVETVVAAMQHGAYDYLSKPVDRTKLETIVKNAIEHNHLSLRIAQLEREATGDGYGELIGRTAPMKQLFRQMDRVAASDISVLIRGESGTGKELIARAIHDNSGRRRRSLVALNCAAIPEALQESELFGHERGSFTGATDRRIGKFESANGGTLFLDEVAELSLPLQAKLLRVLQSRTFHRVGGTAEIRSDFRLVAATHQPLAELVAAGKFREDLYFRIAVFEIDVPPLRDRADDVPPLVQAFASQIASAQGKTATFTPDAMRLMVAYSWPGNVRELQNAVHRALVSADFETVQPEDLPAAVRQVGSRSERRAAGLVPGETVPEVEAAGRSEVRMPESASQPSWSFQSMNLDEIERAAITEALRRSNGNASKAIRALGIGRTTLYRKLKQYGLTQPS